MATPVLMPKQGQTVESCIIVGWKKAVGDSIDQGEILCEVETDKAMLEVESPVAGTVLALFFQEGDEVPVLTHIAAVGEPGEDVTDLRPDGVQVQPERVAEPAEAAEVEAAAAPEPVASAGPNLGAGQVAISPRARKLAEARGVEPAGLAGSGPGGRIIERDVQALLAQMPKMTPLARSMVAKGDFTPPAQGSGVSGRVLAGDLTSAGAAAPAPATAQAETGAMPPVAAGADQEVEVIPLKGVRKVIAQRMLESLQTTAQLTLNATADARAILAYRKRLKATPEEMSLQGITINDLVLFAVSRILPRYPALNALFTDNTITRYQNVHLAVAVDTPRGLVVPVMPYANRLSLQQISQEAKRLATACLEGTVLPDELTGGTFTVTNLGSFGVESFTPVLNPPQVGILGVGNINLKPVEVAGEVQFVPHLGLSLTINHQVVDGAPAARFLQALAQGLAEFELLLAR